MLPIGEPISSPEIKQHLSLLSAASPVTSGLILSLSDHGLEIPRAERLHLSIPQHWGMHSSKTECFLWGKMAIRIALLSIEHGIVKK